MADYIKIYDLEVYANHGVFPEENRLGQKFLFSVELEVDMMQACIGDWLEDSINYGAVSHDIAEFVKEHTYQLLEHLGEEVCRMLLMKYEKIKSIKLEIKKPWAPVGLPLDTVAVEMTRCRHTVYLSLGSNMGDKKAYLDGALKALEEHPCIQLIQTSDFIETKPYGGVEQDDFLNACAKIETVLYPQELLEELHSIEQSANRTREIHWGPRTLDLDILFYDDMILETKQLIIPHKEISYRDFVLTPMVEIAPNYKHPVLHKTMAQLKEELEG